ncbi:13386_t:CDS:2 [Ambispora gerdemannii]|uniref:13386_t:CDS:1 n=1 Tax=Ambispora gerdemannii TaxID=144530 RepID=A0A9N9GCN5_9GLOM|nr:13386_t:CDS:2 [Ambispora gerdemannii]
MIKFDLLCISILACLIAVAHTQSDDCQLCINACNSVLSCTGTTDIYQFLSLSQTEAAPCACSQNFINGYARCPYCSTYANIVLTSNVVSFVSTCKRYGYPVTSPNSTKNNGSSSVSSTSTNGSSSGNSTNADGSSSGSSQNSSSTGGISKGAIVGLASGGSAILGFAAAALGVYYKWLKVKQIKK